MSCQVIQWICHHVINDSKVETGDEKKTNKINDNKKQQQNNAALMQMRFCIFSTTATWITVSRRDSKWYKDRFKASQFHLGIPIDSKTIQMLVIQKERFKNGRKGKVK